MQGTIAQIISLTTHGSVFLTGRPTDGFYPNNSTFKFCEYVRFVDLKKNGAQWDELPYAEDPPSWFERLKNEGATAVRMIYASTGGQQVGDRKISDRMLVGFVGGGGRWILEVVKSRGSDFWEVGWKVGDKDRKDQRIWRVTYGRIAANQAPAGNPPNDLAGLKARLGEILRAIGAFARNHKLDGFAQAFERGLAQLDAADPAGPYHVDLAPASALPLPAAQLLAAAQSAWVFGGMGSWNDMGFEGEDQETYERLSEELYKLLNATLVVAANAGTSTTAQPAPRPWWKLWN